VLGEGAHGVQVVERHAHETRHERLEPGLYFAASRRRQGGERAAVKRLLHDHDRRLGDAALVPVLARNLDRRLVGLQAGIAEEHLVQPGDLGEAVGGRLLHGNAKQVGGVHHPADLLGERARQPGVSIAKGVHRDAGEGVEILLARLVPEPHAFAAHEGHRLPGVGVHDVGHRALPK